MRVSFAMRYQNMTRQIGARQEDLSRLSDQLASGQGLQRPSTDPAAWSQASTLTDGLRQLDTYQNNLDFAVGWNNQTDQALNSLHDLLTKARELGIRAVSVSPELGVAELNQVIEEAVQAANQDANGRYLFGGDAGTDSALEPFSVTRDADGTVTAVSNFQSYNASESWQTSTRIGKNTTQVVNVDGRAVFLDDPSVDSSGGSPDDNILQHLVALRDAMQAGDTGTIQDQLSFVETAQERVLSQNSAVGARLSSLERRADFLTSLKVDRENRRSELKDTDLATTITEFQLKGTALEAAYKTASMLDGLNLQDYL